MQKSERGIGYSFLSGIVNEWISTSKTLLAQIRYHPIQGALSLLCRCRFRYHSIRQYLRPNTPKMLPKTRRCSLQHLLAYISLSDTWALIHEVKKEVLRGPSAAFPAAAAGAPLLLPRANTSTAVNPKGPISSSLAKCAVSIHS